MSGKITVTFKGGKRRVLKSPDTLPMIDGRREAYFVFNNFQVYTGYSDGVIDEDGDFCLRAGNSGIKGGFEAIKRILQAGNKAPKS